MCVTVLVCVQPQTVKMNPCWMTFWIWYVVVNTCNLLLRAWGHCLALHYFSESIKMFFSALKFESSCPVQWLQTPFVAVSFPGIPSQTKKRSQWSCLVQFQASGAIRMTVYFVKMFSKPRYPTLSWHESCRHTYTTPWMSYILVYLYYIIVFLLARKF